MSAILGINRYKVCDYRHYAMGATAHVVRSLVEWERARMVSEVYMASNEGFIPYCGGGATRAIEWVDEWSTMEACSNTRRSILIAPMQKQTFL